MRFFVNQHGMAITRVFDIIERLRTYAPKENLLNEKRDGKWKGYSFHEFDEITDAVAAGLLSIGIQPGDKVLLIAANSPQWNFVDFGCQKAGIITVPVFPTISNDDLAFIAKHSESKAVFFSEAAFAKKMVILEKEAPNLKFAYAFKKLEGYTHFDELLNEGRANPVPSRLKEIQNGIAETDVFSILYTSGTTGQPKGVMVMHRNLAQNVLNCKDLAPFSPEWKSLSFLPLNHVYERFVNALYLFHGVSIYYAESFETIGDNCREIHPQMFVAVPRILERVLERIIGAGEKLTGFKRKIFDWSVALAERYEYEGANGAWYELQRSLADRLVYKKWRAAIGGEVKVIVSGGAALNPRIERVFACAGLDLLQGYGLTETAVVVAVNRYPRKDRAFGTVGIVVDNTQVKLAEEDGEILVKSPSVMKGYFKNETATAETFDQEGWLHTGDIGTMIDGRFLKITDRKKELFKTSAGKYISPVAIENKIKECRFVEQCMVLGDTQKFASALITPSRANYKDYCKTANLPYNEAELDKDDHLQQLIHQHIKKMNTTLAPYEQIKRQRIVNDVWSVDSGEITPKLSLKRKNITEKYKHLVIEIFGAGD